MLFFSQDMSNTCRTTRDKQNNEGPILSLFTDICDYLIANARMPKLVHDLQPFQTLKVYKQIQKQTRAEYIDPYRPPYDHIIHFWNSLHHYLRWEYLHLPAPGVTSSDVYQSSTPTCPNLPQSNHPDKILDGIYKSTDSTRLRSPSFYPRFFLEIQSNTWLVDISQIGSFPQVGIDMKNIGNHHPVTVLPLPHATLPGETHCFTPKISQVRLGGINILWKATHTDNSTSYLGKKKWQPRNRCGSFYRRFVLFCFVIECMCV